MNLYSILLSVIYRVGFKLTAVRLSYRWGRNHTKTRRYNAAHDFQDKQRAFRRCAYCTWLILPGDVVHDFCEEQLREVEESEEAAWEWYYSRCEASDCWEDAVINGFCVVHDAEFRQVSDFLELDLDDESDSSDDDDFGEDDGLDDGFDPFLDEDPWDIDEASREEIELGKQLGLY